MNKHMKILYVLVLVLFCVVVYQQYELKQLQSSEVKLLQKIVAVETSVNSSSQSLAEEIGKLKTNMKDFHPAMSQLKVSAEEIRKAVEEFFTANKPKK